MPFPSPDPNNSIEKFATAVTLYPHQSGQVGDSVYYEDEFADPVEIEAGIHSASEADVEDFRVDTDGQPDEGGERLVCDVPAAHTASVTTDDSIDYDGRAWRVTQPRHATRNGFTRYLLVPDTRRSAGGKT